MKKLHVLLPAILACFLSTGCGASEQYEAAKEDPTPPVAQREDTNSRLARIEAENIKEVRRRLKSIEPKEPGCVSYAYDEPSPPFPDNLEQVFENTEISVFAYPNTYTCGEPRSERIACDVGPDSQYFIRKGQLGVKMYFRGEGELRVVFGTPRIFECRKLRNSERSAQSK